MASVVIFDPNQTPAPVLSYLQFVDDPLYNTRPDCVMNPNLAAVLALPMRYWKVATGVVVPMTVAEQNAVDAALTAAAISSSRADSVSKLNASPDGLGVILRAIAGLVVDQLNVLREWDVSFQAAVAASTSLANLQTRVAALPSLADITLAQARTAIQSKINSGTVDN